MQPSQRPKTRSGKTIGYKTGCGHVYITVNVDESENPVEVFARMGKVGGCGFVMLESLGRVLSVALRCGVDVNVLTKQCLGLSCPNGIWENGERVESCVSAVGMALRMVLEEKEEKNV